MRPVKTILVGFGLSYSKYDFSFFNTPDASAFSSFEQMHALRPTLLIGKKLDSNWTLNAAFSPVISSNFKNGIKREDILAGGRLTVSKRWKSQNGFALFTFGLAYGTLLGEPQIIPLLSFTKKINSSFSYFLGIPATGVKYHINERHSFKLRAAVSGLYANNAQEISFNGFEEVTNTKLLYNALDVALEHRYRIQPNLTTVARLGFVPTSQLEIRGPGQELIYDFLPKSTAYFTMGLSFNLNINTNEIRN